MDFKRSKNLDYMYGVLTSDKITQMSGGRIPKMSPQQAAGMLGSWAIETGDPTLTNLDVVEKNARAGRGLSQYTGARRVPYDRARNDAINRGIDPNSAEWQMQYFADEYAGKYDQNGRSLIGWTKSHENMRPGLSPGEYARTITGSAASGSGYFRPGVPHTDRRMKAAEAIYGLYSASAQPNAMSIPKAPAKAPSNPAQDLMINMVKGGLNFLGIPLGK